jgi:hypothetical protein
MLQPTRLTLAVPRRQQPGRGKFYKVTFVQILCSEYAGRQEKVNKKVREIKAKNWGNVESPLNDH